MHETLVLQQHRPRVRADFAKIAVLNSIHYGFYHSSLFVFDCEHCHVYCVGKGEETRREVNQEDEEKAGLGLDPGIQREPLGKHWVHLFACNQVSLTSS